MRLYRSLFGFLLAAGPGFALGVAVFVTMDAAGWPVALDAPRGDFIRWGIVGAGVGGLLGLAHCPVFRDLSLSLKKLGTDESIGMWGLLTWEAGIRGPLLLIGLFAGTVGAVVGGFSGETRGNHETGAFLGAMAGLLAGIVVGLVAASLLFVVLSIMRSVAQSRGR
jgi:hypothetical protein